MKSIKYTGLLLLVLALIAGCDTGSVAPTATPALNATGEATAATTTANTPAPVSGDNHTPTIDLANPVKVTIALGYNPDVQFTPFYVALNKGYYKEQGLDVTFKHGIVPDQIKLLGQGGSGVDFAVASGDELIPARLQGIPVVYVMTWYQQYPVAAVSINGKGPTLKTPADLKGKVVGVPGPFGSTYTGLLALLRAGGLTLSDITLKTIGFTQVENLTRGQVDVAMVYAANEPVQLRAQGLDVSTLMVSDYAKLASNGLVTNLDTFGKKAPIVGRLVKATQKGITDTIKDPEGAFAEALKEVPEAGGANKTIQMQVLKEATKLMQAKPGSPASESPTGWTDVEVWAATQDFLLDTKVIQKTGKVQEMFSNRFVGNATK